LDNAQKASILSDENLVSLCFTEHIFSPVSINYTHFDSIKRLCLLLDCSVFFLIFLKFSLDFPG